MIVLNIFVVLMAIALRANAARIKDIANVRGVRENQLIGYGLVVGLNGTGDGKAEFTSKSLARMLDSIGLKLDSKELGSKNVAAVLVTASLPAFARAGNKLDITVNSIGEASSLSGGVLVQTPLRAANQQVYAVAQGGILVGGGGGDGAQGSGKAHLTVGQVPNGAIIERDLDVDFASQKMFRLTLHSPDFTTAARMAKTINLDLGGKYAAAKDSGTVDVIVPFSYEGNAVELMAGLESLDVNPDRKAKVVVNEKTGTVVIGDGVRVSKVAISHGNLALKVSGAENKKDKQGDRVAMVEGEVSIGELVKAMNSLGVSPKDLITILQNIKAAGALQGELDIL
ncbi:MAG: flagellar basal body P-ring protein FlgI [Bdellovibrionia bacterium]